MCGKIRIAPAPEGLLVADMLLFGLAGWKEDEPAPKSYTAEIQTSRRRLRRPDVME
jgi:hypothetical protein